MVFSSMLFLWLFLPVTIIGYYLIRDRYRNILLLMASLIFYAWGEPVYIFLMIFSILVNWVAGLMIDRDPSHKKLILLLDIAFNIGLLGYYKYSNFIIDSINNIFHTSLNHREIALPIGISFFTFQILSYIIDLYRGEYKAQKNVIRLALYISFFPQLIAGPIVKYRDINEQLQNRKLSTEKMAAGVRRFMYGLSKKVIIANTLAKSVDQIYGLNKQDLTGWMAWMAAIFYTLQIYYDFSGYSDMAIGLGKMFGFEFQENFLYPYTSFSIQDFWRKWHISLSSWFREYIYIPLGGNRKGEFRTYLNLSIVFFVTGLWHGAGVTFVLWGLYHGFFSILERLGLNKFWGKFKAIGHIYALLIVNFGWVLFRADTISQALSFMKRMLLPWKYTHTSVIYQEMIPNSVLFFATAGIIGSGLIQSLLEKSNICRLKYSYFELILCSALFIICISMLAGNSYNPFIYFRF